MAIKEIINAPDRIKTPLIKAGKEWREASYSKALAYVAERLNSVKAKYGAESLAIHVGRSGVKNEFAHYLKRFCDAFGTPNYSTAGSHCHFSKKMASEMTCGYLPVPDFENSHCILPSR